MTNGFQMAGIMAEQLRQAEINEHWSYMEHLLKTLRSMGARVMKVHDPRFNWRGDYIVSFKATDALPGI